LCISRRSNTRPYLNTSVEASTMAFRCFTSPSAGDDRTATRAAQDCTYRTRLRDREHDDRQRRLAGKRECGRVHHLVVALNRLRMRQTVESLGRRVLFGIGAIDAIDI